MVLDADLHRVDAYSLGGPRTDVDALLRTSRQDPPLGPRDMVGWFVGFVLLGLGGDRVLAWLGRPGLGLVWFPLCSVGVGGWVLLQAREASTAVEVYRRTVVEHLPGTPLVRGRSLLVLRSAVRGWVSLEADQYGLIEPIHNEGFVLDDQRRMAGGGFAWRFEGAPGSEAVALSTWVRPEPGHVGARFDGDEVTVQRRTCRRAAPTRASGPGW